MTVEERLLRLEKAIIELHRIDQWNSEGFTWQAIWDKLDSIVKELKEEHETQD